jgi:galactokinase
MNQAVNLLELSPVPLLLNRVRAELSATFPPGKSMRISRAPGRLDVMGGIADYTGSLVCEMPLDRAAATALIARDDRQVSVMSFNLHDDNKPFTLQMSLDDLAKASIEQLREGFAQPGRKWAGYLLGCLAILHEAQLLDLADPKLRGFNLALYSDVPSGAGVSSSAAIEVATMMNLVEHFGLRHQLDALKVGAMCQQVENRVVGAPCGIMDQVASSAGEAGSFMQLICQPHELIEPLFLPAGTKVCGINSNVKHSVGGGAYGKTRCAAFMGHKIILDQIRELGTKAGKELLADPMNGYLANLDPEDYKKLFRGKLPERMLGRDFITMYGSTIDKATTIDPATPYTIQAATDHHVLEARRVREFVKYLKEAHSLDAGSEARKLSLDKAGHLMYASHVSYTNNAMLGAIECDTIVDLVRANERFGLYGAKITGGGSGGTVAVLMNDTPEADGAVRDIMLTYHQRENIEPELIAGSSPGAWRAGTVLVNG